MRAGLRLPSIRGIARLTLALIGLGACAAGVWIAWSASAATPLLVLGAVFAILGLFDWSEIRAKYRDVEVELRRAEATERAREKLVEISKRDDIPEDARGELNEAVSELVVASGSELPNDARPSHSKAADGILLNLAFPGLGVLIGPLLSLSSYSCEIHRGRSSSGFSSGSRSVPRMTSPVITVHFPNDFPGATLEPGNHDVYWFKSFAPLGAFGPRTLVAQDRFSIPPV